MTLVHKDIVPVSECIYTSERFVVVKVSDTLIVNVYLPCSDTEDRLLVCTDVLMDISSWRQKYQSCDCLIGGDFNADLDIQCSASNT